MTEKDFSKKDPKSKPDPEFDEKTSSSESSAAKSDPSETGSWRPFWLAFASAIGFVLAFPPIGLSWIAWLVPFGFLKLIHEPEWGARRPKWQVWFGCFVCWMILFQCVRLPHWAGYIGWPFLAGYLATFPFLFVVMSRQLVHTWRIPLYIAAPICWCGLELLQARIMSGISLGMISHTQVNYPLLIQVADIAGCFTVSFVILGITAGVFCFVTALKDREKRPWIPAIQTAFLIGFVVAYGSYRLKETDEKQIEHDFVVALIQGSIDTQFPNEEEVEAYFHSIDKEYSDLSISSRKEQVDLILWPESMFPKREYFSSAETPSSLDQRRLQAFEHDFALTALKVNGALKLPPPDSLKQPVWINKPVPMIVGANSIDVENLRRYYNTALHINSRGEVESRYAKMNLVLFGEYVPLGDRFPVLYNIFPTGAGLKSGDRPVVMSVGEHRFIPNICFESTYPHLIRRHVAASIESGKKQLTSIVNLSNDGWFWGSNALDMHFANNVYRAVENRTPVLVAANTGFSGQIDGAGRVISKGPRRKSAVVYVKLLELQTVSVYQTIGDWPWFFCLILVFAGFFRVMIAGFSKKKLQ